MRGLFCLLLLLSSAAPAEEVFLHSIPLELGPGVDLAHPETLQVSAMLGTSLARRVAPYASADDAGPDAYRDASFVIDYDEPSVEALRAKLVERYGASPSVVQLVHFTHDFVAHKGLERGFELASQVASHASGDCTEHAVLLTALARATGTPARVVVGVALIREHTAVAAYGHAWSELHEDGAWRVGEATGLDAGALLGYIAVSPLLDEGPGYSLPLVELFSQPWFKGLVMSQADSSP